jgi:hypothetical protein
MKGNSWVVLVALVVVVGLAALTIFVLGATNRNETATQPPAAPPSVARPAPPAAPQPVAPSFDAVHIGPDGKAVIAGRAAPGAEVTILDRGQEIGHVTADSNGEFVFMPDQPLPAGPQELSLASRTPGEASTTPSTKSLAVLVPDRTPSGAREAPVAVLLPQSAADAARPAQLGARQPHRVTLDMVEYDASGRIVFTGRADAKTQVELFVNGHSLATAIADASGTWSAESQGGVPVGRYRLRLESHAPDGAGPEPLVLELRRAAPGELGEGNYLAVVPGNTLWHLALRSFGEGVRYVEIYRANRERIENPDRIYPGELLALPAKP